MAVNPGEIPAGEAALYAAGGVLTAVAWVAMLGLQHGWHATIGASLRWLAHKFDAVTIGIRHVGRVTPLGPIADAFRAVDKDTHHALGVYALNCEHATTFLFSGAAAQIRLIGHWIEEYGLDGLAFVHRIEHTVIPRILRHALHFAEHVAREVVRPVERFAVRLYRHARHDFMIAYGYAVRAEHAAAHAIAVTDHWVGRTAKQARAESRRISWLEGLLTGAAAVALVGTALGKLGLRWLRCSNVKHVGRALCRMNPEWVLALLSDAFEAMIVLDLCRYALAAQRLGRIVVPQLGDVLLVQNAVCLGGGASLPSASDSPELTTAIALPSAHD